MSLLDYYSFKDVLKKEEIRNINTFINNNFDNYETQGKAATTGKTAKVQCIFWHKIQHLLNSHISDAVRVVQQEFGYNVYDLNYWDQVNLNIYTDEDKGKYNWHVDATDARANHDIKATVLINLTEEDIEGGAFKIFNQEEYSPPHFDSPGSILIFKSSLNHKVEPVIKGTRKTLAAFLIGPKFT